MAMKFKLVKDDTLPEIRLSMTDETTGQPFDLSNPATAIRMYFRKVGETVLKETLTLVKVAGIVTAIDEDTGRMTISTAPPYDVPGSGGLCAVQFSDTTLNEAGQFQGEVEITFADGGRLTWYEIIGFSIRDDFNEDA